MSTELQTVVVVGAGSGALVARQLSTVLDPAKHKLILVARRPHFTHLPGCLRASVTPEGAFEEQVLIPLDKLMVNGNGTIITSEVTSISEEGEDGGNVTLATGDTIHWDILVLASGSHWEGPLMIPDSKSDTIEWFKGWQAKFAKAKDVLLVGGGAIAIELAGEIKDLDSSKNVTIVHNGDLLLNKAYPDKFRKDLQQRLRARGVNVILSDSVPEDALTSTQITTVNGETLTPDLVIPCRGPRPNTSLLSAAFGPKSLTDAGHAKVLGTFQLAAHPRVFACGDIVDLAEQRQISKYVGHAAVIAKNVLALFNGQPAQEIYKGAKEMILITIGKEGGAGYMDMLWGISLGGWVTAMLKSRELLVARVGGIIGQ
ncbi:hypothetical protein DXG01_002725 [Tephrocybe rancida]|nr:hypothetical protein DXG01_002725 [Tephrocybe rancida]